MAIFNYCPRGFCGALLDEDRSSRSCLLWFLKNSLRCCGVIFRRASLLIFCVLRKVVLASAVEVKPKVVIMARAIDRVSIFFIGFLFK